MWNSLVENDWVRPRTQGRGRVSPWSRSTFRAYKKGTTRTGLAWIHLTFQVGITRTGLAWIHLTFQVGITRTGLAWIHLTFQVGIISYFTATFDQFWPDKVSKRGHGTLSGGPLTLTASKDSVCKAWIRLDHSFACFVHSHAISEWNKNKRLIHRSGHIPFHVWFFLGVLGVWRGCVCGAFHIVTWLC